MNVMVFIQARLGSTRLPGKVLLDLEGKTVLERVIERARAAKEVRDLLVVTTLGRDDLKIVGLCAKNGTRVFCGSEDDVLDRFYQAAKILRPDSIVRITADCPFMDPAVIDRVVGRHRETGADYTANVLEETYPDGEDVEVMTYAALERAWEQARLASEREHVTPYIRNHGEIFRLESVICETDYSKLRWTLDNPEDYVVIKRVYEALSRKAGIFGMAEVLEYFSRDPEAFSANSGIKRNEGYRKSLSEDEVKQNGKITGPVHEGEKDSARRDPAPLETAGTVPSRPVARILQPGEGL